MSRFDAAPWSLTVKLASAVTCVLVVAIAVAFGIAAPRDLGLPHGNGLQVLVVVVLPLSILPALLFVVRGYEIDGSFVRDIQATGGPDDGVLAKAIISLAHSLKFKVVAEGVETQGQYEFLKRNDCDEMQGYFYSPPVPAPDCEVLFTGRQLTPESPIITRH